MTSDLDTRTTTDRAGLADVSTRGPSGRQAGRYWTRMLRDPLASYSELRRDFGDAVRIPFTRRRAVYLFSGPEHAEQVLVAQQDAFVKAFTYRPLKAFLGDGLLTSAGEVWRRHRSIVQSTFSHRHIQGFAPDIVAATRERVSAWPTGGQVDVSAQMHTLTMDVVGRVLFGTELAADAGPIGQAVTRLQDSATIALLLPSGGSPTRLRAISTRLVPKLGAAADTFERLVDRIIDERLAAPHPQPLDLLDLLIGGAGPQQLSRLEIHDEVMTLVLAGHETTANAMTWTFTLLSRYPEARRRLHAEVDDVLRGRDAEAADIDKLVWTRAVISEAMRLYPPAWTIERDAITDVDIAGTHVPAGCTVAISPYLLHRNEQFWANPEGFDPSRFLPEHSAERPKYAYLPFGGGRRICVGAGLAQMEAALILATIASTHDLDLAPGTPLRPRAGVTIHPAGPVPMTPARRSA